MAVPFLGETHLKNPKTPISFLAPETLFTLPVSPASDIWALGCLIFQLKASKRLFPVFFGAVEEGLIRIIQTLGSLPMDWKNYFVNQTEGDWWFEFQTPLYALKSQVKEIEVQPGLFLSLLRGALAYEPGERFTALQVLMHPCCATQ